MNIEDLSSNEPDSVQTDHKYDKPAAGKVKITVQNDYLFTRPMVRKLTDYDAQCLFYSYVSDFCTQ